MELPILSTGFFINISSHIALIHILCSKLLYVCGFVWVCGFGVVGYSGNLFPEFYILVYACPGAQHMCVCVFELCGVGGLVGLRGGSGFGAGAWACVFVGLKNPQAEWL